MPHTITTFSETDSVQSALCFYMSFIRHGVTDATIYSIGSNVREVKVKGQTLESVR